MVGEGSCAQWLDRRVGLGAACPEGYGAVMPTYIKRLPYVPDEDEARALTQEAIERSERGAHEDWLREAEALVRRVARDLSRFSANDVWAAGLTPPKNRRALGAVMQKLAREGYLVKVDAEVSRWGHGQAIGMWRRA